MKDSGRPPGLECPNCGYLIQLTIPILLSRRSIYCTACGLELKPDPKASGESLEILARFHERLSEIDAERLSRSNLSSARRGKQ